MGDRRRGYIVQSWLGVTRYYWSNACCDMEGENRVYRLRYRVKNREKRERRRKTRDTYKRESPQNLLECICHSCHRISNNARFGRGAFSMLVGECVFYCRVVVDRHPLHTSEYVGCVSTFFVGIGWKLRVNARVIVFSNWRVSFKAPVPAG